MYDVPSIVAEPLLLEPLRRSVLDGERPAFLRSAKLKLTARCNLTCVMCKYGKGLDLPELDGERFSVIVEQMAELGCRKVHFSGGEVLARRDFESIAGRAAAAGLKVTFTSNLTLLTKERAKALMRHKISSVSTSLDGATARVHEDIRGIAGAFKKTLKAMGYLARERERRGRRTRVRVNFVMMRRNYKQYPALIRLAAEHGATEVHPMPVDEKTSSTRRLSKRLIREYNEEIAPRVREERVRAGMSIEDAYLFPFGRADDEVTDSGDGLYARGYYKDRVCFAPWTHVFVAWDGKVYLCCMTNGRIEPLGDLATESVADVYFGDRMARVRDEMTRHRPSACHRCDMFLEENRALQAAIGPVADGPKKLRVVG